MNFSEGLEKIIEQTNGDSDGAFEGTAVKIIKLPSTLKEIGRKTFYRCLELEECILPQNLEKIGDRAFKGSGLISSDLPSSLEEIGNEAYAETLIKKVKIGDKIKTLGNRAFGKCSNLKEVILSPSLRQIINIENGKQKDVPITYIFDPEMLNKILEIVFEGCGRLDKLKIDLDGKMKEYSRRNSIMSVSNRAYEGEEI